MILIRADVNELIGTGHVMRCLSIASAIVRRGVEVLFITADHKGDTLLRQNGFNSVCLDTDWTDLDQELPLLLEMIKSKKPSLLLIDSYYVTEKYFNELSKVITTAYMDDLYKARWNTDILINYNIYSSVFDYSIYSGNRLLLGSLYAPLREEFKGLPEHSAGMVQNILVSAGGADPERITERLISEICPVWPDIHFHFVVGAFNPRIDKIREMERNNIILHINEKHMSALMKDCDIAISAAGTTLYELCAAGIPTITFTLADNQLVASEQFSRKGLMLSAGDCRGNKSFFASIKSLLIELIPDAEKRRTLSKKMQQLVDGKGTDRIAANLIVRLKPAEEKDFEDYYEVKCGQSEILWMGYDGIPARDMMERVFHSRLGSCRFERPGDKRIFMIQADGKNVGMIQFSLSEEGLEFGLSVKESEQRKGYASVGMQQAVEIARAYSDHLFVHIRDDNTGSIRACMSAGLKPTDDVELKEFHKAGLVPYRKYEKFVDQ